MDIKWEISDKSLSMWRAFIDKNLSNKFVKERKRRNVSRSDDEVELSKQKLWMIHIGCQVTTQQRSGPNSLARQFLDSDSKILNYSDCIGSVNLEEFIRSELSLYKLRRSNIIANNLSLNLKYLENGGWSELFDKLETLKSETTIYKERIVASYLKTNFKGFGLKQSRNFLQWIGLSRYEIPIDSRVCKKMRELGSIYVPTALALNDEPTYLLIEDGIQLLAKKLNTYPCIIDACIFSSFDTKKN